MFTLNALKSGLTGIITQVLHKTENSKFSKRLETASIECDYKIQDLVSQFRVSACFLGFGTKKINAKFCLYCTIYPFGV